MSAIVIDSKRLLRPVETMRILRGTVRGGPLDQIKIEVDAHCNWKTKRPPSNRQLGNVIFESPLGLASIQNAKFERPSPDGGAEGLSTGVTLFLDAKPNAQPQKYRCILSVKPDYWQRVQLPLLVEDRSSKRGGVGVALDIPDVDLKFYYFEVGPKTGSSAYTVIDANYKNESPDLDKIFNKQSTNIRFLISYLTGLGLDGNSTIVKMDRDGSPIVIEQCLGRRNLRNPYRPIPYSDMDMLACNLAAGHKVLPPLNGENLTRSLGKLLEEPNLITPLEYLRRFNEVPSEMRGALLSIALESATKHLEQRGLLTAKKPLSDEIWNPVRQALIKTIEQMASTGEWTKDQKNPILGRVNNLNNPTNADQLTKPFEILHLTLRDEEKAAIKHRNDFIHRGRLLKVEELERDPARWKAVWSAEMVLYTVVNKLLLRYLGYSGPLIDWGRKEFGSPEPAFEFLET